MHKLLLADDSVTIQRVIELTFSGEDIQVVAVNDGEQAIARIPSNSPTSCLADIGMPKKGGYDVAAFVKGRLELEHIPVLPAGRRLRAGRPGACRAGALRRRADQAVRAAPGDRTRARAARGREGQPGARRGARAARGGDVPAGAGARAAIRGDFQAGDGGGPIAAAPAAEQTDAALDEYFESLNAAFDSVDPGTPAVTIVNAPAVEQGTPTVVSHRRRGDSLDDYFDRLQHGVRSRPAGRDAGHAAGCVGRGPPKNSACPRSMRSSARRHPTGRTATVSMNGHGAYRNPIVDALEAMLGRPEPVLTQPSLPGLPEFSRDEEGPAATHE